LIDVADVLLALGHDCSSGPIPDREDAIEPGRDGSAQGQVGRSRSLAAQLFAVEQ
jgi:hypothetical protein